MEDLQGGWNAAAEGRGPRGAGSGGSSMHSSGDGSSGGAASAGDGESHQDTTAWMWGIYREMRIASREPLFAYFRGAEKGCDLTPEILNLVGRMAKAGFPDHDPASFVPDPAGGTDRLDCALAASYLYYRVCEWELARRFPMQPNSADAALQRRFKGLARLAPDPRTMDFLRQGDFHAALLHCALEITAFCAHPEQLDCHYPAMTARLGRQVMGVSLWAAIGSFRGCFAATTSPAAGPAAIGSPDGATPRCLGAGGPPLPASVAAQLGRMEADVLGGAGLAHGSVFHTLAVHGGGYHYADGDPTLACEFFSAFACHLTAGGLRVAAALAAGRSAGGGGGAAAGQQDGTTDSFPFQVAQLLDELLLRDAGLFYGQPAAVMMGCATYILAKLRSLDVRFSDVEHAILTTLPGTDPSVFARAELDLQPNPGNAAAAGGQQGTPATPVPLAPVLGPMRQFYNTRFLPAAEDIARAVAAGTAARLPPVRARPDHPLLLRRRQQIAAAAGDGGGPTTLASAGDGGGAAARQVLAAAAAAASSDGRWARGGGLAAATPMEADAAPAVAGVGIGGESEFAVLPEVAPAAGAKRRSGCEETTAVVAGEPLLGSGTAAAAAAVQGPAAAMPPSGVGRRRVKFAEEVAVSSLGGSAGPLQQQQPLRSPLRVVAEAPAPVAAIKKGSWAPAGGNSEPAAPDIGWPAQDKENVVMGEAEGAAAGADNGNNGGGGGGAVQRVLGFLGAHKRPGGRAARQGVGDAAAAAAAAAAGASSGTGGRRRAALKRQQPGQLPPASPAARMLR